MAEGAINNFSGRFETEVTSKFINSSRLSFFKAPSPPTAPGSCADKGAGNAKPKPASNSNPVTAGKPATDLFSGKEGTT
jgi:hypothetical protein